MWWHSGRGAFSSYPRKICTLPPGGWVPVLPRFSLNQVHFKFGTWIQSYICDLGPFFPPQHGLFGYPVSLPHPLPQLHRSALTQPRLSRSLLLVETNVLLPLVLDSGIAPCCFSRADWHSCFVQELFPGALSWGSILSFSISSLDLLRSGYIAQAASNLWKFSCIIVATHQLYTLFLKGQPKGLLLSSLYPKPLNIAMETTVNQRHVYIYLCSSELNRLHF